MSKKAAQPQAVAEVAPKTEEIKQVPIVLPRQAWEIVAQSLDGSVRTGGVQAARVVLPIFGALVEQLQASDKESGNKPSTESAG